MADKQTSHDDANTVSGAAVKDAPSARATPGTVPAHLHCPLGDGIQEVELLAKDWGEPDSSWVRVPLPCGHFSAEMVPPAVVPPPGQTP